MDLRKRSISWTLSAMRGLIAIPRRRPHLALRFLSAIFQTDLHKKRVFLYGDGWRRVGLWAGWRPPRGSRAAPRCSIGPPPPPTDPDHVHSPSRAPRRAQWGQHQAGPGAQIFRKKRKDDVPNRAEPSQKLPQPTQGPARPPTCPPEVAMTSPGLAVRRTDIDGSILSWSIGRGSRAQTTFQRCRHHPKTSPSPSPSPPFPGKPPRPSPSLCPQERARRALGP